MKVKILGIDPGSRVTGFGLIEVDGARLIPLRHGVISMPASADFGSRLRELGLGLRQLLEEHQPHEMVLERLFLGKNADSAFKLGHARGVLMYEACLQHIPVAEYAARQIKKGVTGRGAAEKEEVRLVVERLLGISGIQKLDASDALAMACFHAFERQKQRLLRRAVEI